MTKKKSIMETNNAQPIQNYTVKDLWDCYDNIPVEIQSYGEFCKIKLVVEIIKLCEQFAHPVENRYYISLCEYIDEFQVFEKLHTGHENQELNSMSEIANSLAKPSFSAELENLKNSTTMYVDTTIVITDPTIFLSPADRDKKLIECNIRGIESDTLAGNWGCHVYDMQNQGAIGEFGAINNKVCVARLDDIVAYKPDFLKMIKTNKLPCKAAIIDDFKGEIQIVKADQECYVFGSGVHMTTNQQFTFTSCQTSQQKQ